VANVVETIQHAYKLAGSGRTDAALEELRQYLRHHNDQPDVQHHLGLMLLQLGQGDQALYHLQRSTAAAPSNAEFHSNYATALNMNGKAAAAIDSYRRALLFNSAWFPAHLGLSSALLGQREYAAAAESARQALQISPERVEPWVNLGLALNRGGRSGEAAKALRDGLEKVGDHPLLLINLAAVLNYRPEPTPEEVFDIHARLGKAMQAAAGAGFTPHFADTNPDRRLRIGYMSQDLRDHSIAHFLRPILAHHDRRGFEPVLYSAAPTPDETTRELGAAAAGMVDISRMPDPVLDQRIRADRIDILVDLSGHTSGSRLSLLARRAAPVQVTYMGYPNTTGLRAVGYRIVDAITDPPGSESLATEKLVRMPGCFLCYQPPAYAPEVGPVPSVGAGHVTFGSFNTVQKIVEPVIETWAAVLKAVPGSRLILKNTALSAPSVQADVREQMSRAGVDEDRLELMGRIEDPRAHLALYNRIDVALDTFPYNGTTTTCEALWMGVPVVTMAGDRHAARVGPSLMRAVGADEFVAPSREGYVALAASLAGDTARRTELRRGLRERVRGSTLCDGASFVSALEAEYRGMWRAWCAGSYYS
jgi:protein O-GlcNAc transferase